MRVRYLRRVGLDIPLAEIRAIRRELRAYDGAKALQLTGAGEDTLAVIVGSSTNVHVVLTTPRTFRTSKGDFTASAVAFWAGDPSAAVSKIRAAVLDRAA